LESSPYEPGLARELKELTDTPVVKEVKELADPPGGGIKEKLIGIAQKMLDIPYRFGGSSLLGIDCSGYVQKVFGLLDVVLPRTAREQFRLGKLVGREDLSIGDLVFFRTYAKFPSHVGIYLGDNRFIHASSKDRKVTIDSLDAPYYLKRFIGARRLDMKDPADEI
jgi:cell wall-associated NlpC family hydrolase